MILKNLKIENIRSYEKLDIDFNQGVTVISGVNGSGKSSLLEACFAGIFGSKTLTKDFTIADFVRKGATKAYIKLNFEQNSHEYSMEQVFRNDPDTRKASNTLSVLSIDGEIFTDQAKRTYESMIALLKMDEEAFRNCVYIRQGEIDLLINAKSNDRQKMIDDLLQIGKLEDYRERASSARTGIGRHQRYISRCIKDIKKEIDDLNAINPTDILNKLLTEITQITNQHESVIKIRDNTKMGINERKTKIDEYDNLINLKKSIFDQIQEISIKISQAHDNIELSNNNIQTLKSAIEQLDTSISNIKNDFKVEGELKKIYDDYEILEKEIHHKLIDIKQKITTHKKDMENTQNMLIQFEKQIDDIKKSIDKIKHQQKDEVEQTNKITNKIENINKEKIVLEDKIKASSFTDKTLDNVDETIELVQTRLKIIHGDIIQLKTSKEEIEKRLNITKDLLDKGKCPTCKQNLNNSPIERNFLAEKDCINDFEKRIIKLQNEENGTYSKLNNLKEIRIYSKRVSEYDQQIKSLTQQNESINKMIMQYDNRVIEDQKKIDELNTDIKKLDILAKKSAENIDLLINLEIIEAKKHADSTVKLQLIKTAQQNAIDIDGKKKDIEKINERIENYQEKIVIFQQQQKDQYVRLNEIENKIGGIDAKSLKEQLSTYEEALINMEVKIKELDEKKNKIMQRIGMERNKMLRIDQLETDLSKLTNKLEYVNEIYKNTEDLEGMYIHIRADLRSQNVTTLDTLINQIFNFMYPNNAYSHVRLDHDYNLTVFGKDGTALEPKLLSGGERALFNLILRCAIYRLLSISMGGSDENSVLPPLILDEPTVFLDKGHIKQLIKLIDSMKNFGVKQIIIVSHDEALIDSADHLFYVEKNPTTNISSIIAK